MLQQLGGLWRRLQDQSPARQALILAIPAVVAMLVVLGGLIVWSVASPVVRPRPTVVVQRSPTAVPPTSPPAVVPTTSPTVVALLPTVVVPPTPTPPPPTDTPAPEPTRTPTPAPARSARIVNTEGQGANTN